MLKTMSNFYTVKYGIITNRIGVNPQGTAMSRSVSKALSAASSKAWDIYESSTATNYADCWVQVYKAGRLIAHGFEGSLETV
jgi:hypothetical protein